MADEHPLPAPDSLAFVEDLYEAFRRDPHAVSKGWREYFAHLGNGRGGAPRSGPSWQPASIWNPPGDPRSAGTARTEEGEDALALQDRVDQIIRAYRVRGHLIARFDPLDLPRESHPELDPSHYDLSDQDLDRVFSSRTLAGCPDTMALREILEHLRNTYCRSIGVQFMHIDNVAIKMWLQARMEGSENRTTISREEQLRILTKLTDAVIFEDFIQKKYLGAKRFSLEGAESLIPLLDMAIERAGEFGMAEVVLGMAHRGRLNVLANIIGKSPRQIFWEFEDVAPELHLGGGDVKYHLGYSADRMTASGQSVHLSLCFNPSHLEFVNPVALGRLRAKQDRRGGDDRTHRGMCILIHGDAAFAGQGVTQETLNLSELEGYRTGGTLHVITNNQIGFTTSPAEGRSTLYATAVAKMLQIPIFHVNGEDPEAVAHVLSIAMDFRREFQRDVVIDMYCYRKHGHNEGDEPAFTNPLMYAAIRKRTSIREGYLDHLLRLGEVARDEADEIAVRRRADLEEELSVARSEEYTASPDAMRGQWGQFYGGPEHAVSPPDTGVERERLTEILRGLARVPEGFKPHPKLDRLLDHRREMAEGERPLDWASAEAAALGSLVLEGHPIRFSGQDSARGTFSQRHATLHDVRDGTPYVALRHLSPDQAPISIINSPLSEIAVLGFEYGFSLDHPEGLVIWEAQFGDFVNVAQVIIDQFMVSAEDKWHRLSGLVLLLPHGFEGQGPEHSSARLERFLALAAEDNIQVVNPTTPAQYFHVLRRQALSPWRKPLVVMTPKSLLRHKEAVSSLDDLAEGRFQKLLPDPEIAPGDTRRILFCSGKIYYEIRTKREELGRRDVAILRMEQLYPMSDEELGEFLAPYADGTPVLWVQEEPENSGAWRFLRVRHLDRMLGRFPFSGVSREASASPATGSSASHRMEQERLLTSAFADLDDH
jgi:2-oxoglutarate dehydrogenase E1 component